MVPVCCGISGATRTMLNIQSPEKTELNRQERQERQGKTGVNN
jgi:hypothetical protein